MVLVLVGGVGYGLYWLFTNGPLSASNPDNQDPTTGAYVGPVNAIANAVFPVSNPGGGQTINTSETYTGALQTELSDPVGTLKSILGF